MNPLLFKGRELTLTLFSILLAGPALSQSEPPIVTLVNPLNGAASSGARTIVVGFSRTVSGLETSDFVVTNGTASNLSLNPSIPGRFEFLLTPNALGPISVFLPANSAMSTDAENLPNLASNTLSANNIPAGTFTSGVINLSPGTGGLLEGESRGYFPNPKTFGPSTDLRLANVGFTDGTNSGTVDVTFIATSSLDGIRRGLRGAFGSSDEAGGSALINSDTSVTLQSFAVSNPTGFFNGQTIANVRVAAVYLGNETDSDGATINDVVARGAPSGILSEDMRNDIELASSTVIAGTGAGNGFGVTGIEVVFDLVDATDGGVSITNSGFDSSGGFEVSFEGLDTATTYELRFSPDIETDFTAVSGTRKIPSASTDSFTDPSPAGTRGFYQLFIATPSN